MQFALIVMLLLAVLLAQGEPSPGAATAVTWLSLVGTFILAPATAACGSVWIIRGMHRDYPNCRSWMLRFERLQWLVNAAWLAASAALLVVGRWPQIVRGDWALQRFPLADDLATLAPPLGALVLVWSVYWLAERSLPQNEVSVREPWFASWWEFISLNARQQLGLPLVPVLLVIAAQDLTAYFVPKLSGAALEWGTAVALPMLLLMLPWMLRWIWPTSALPPGELREELEAICKQHRCSVRQILVWHTGGRIPNAAIAGLLPQVRFLLLSDALLHRLTREQIATVVKHECTHVERRHLLLRLLILGLPIWWTVWFRAELPSWQQFFLILGESWGLPSIWQEVVVWPLLAVGYALVAISWYSRWLEYDADLGILAETESDPSERLQQVSPFTAALCLITYDWSQRSWMHPSVVERIAFLRQCARQPEYARQFRLRVDFFNGMLVGAYLTAPLIRWL